MGTLFTLTLYATDERQARNASEAAFSRVDNLEDILSDYQADSELSLLRDHPKGTAIPVSKDLFQVLSRSQEIWKRTGGAFDVTAGPYTRLWRFSRKRKTLPSPKELAEAREAFGMEKLELDDRNRTVKMKAAGMRLDVGGIAKGYAADQAMEVLKARGFSRALLAASGDIRAGEAPPGKSGWSVAIENIDRGQPVSRTLLLRNAAVSTSGDTEQFVTINGTRYSHILDPSTGLGLTNRIQATVIARSATLSDALATSVCILGTARGLDIIRKLPGAAALIIEEHNGRKKLTKSPNFDVWLSKAAKNR